MFHGSVGVFLEYLIPPKTHKNTHEFTTAQISSLLLPCHITSLDCFNRLGRTARDNISSLDLAAKKEPKKKTPLLQNLLLGIFCEPKAFLDSEMVSILPFLALVTIASSLPSELRQTQTRLCCIVWQPFGLIKGFPTIQIKENQQSIHHHGDGDRHDLMERFEEKWQKSPFFFCFCFPFENCWVKVSNKFEFKKSNTQHHISSRIQLIFLLVTPQKKICFNPPDRWASRKTELIPIFHSWSALARIAWNLPGSHRRWANWIHWQSMPPGSTNPTVDSMTRLMEKLMWLQFPVYQQD